MPISLRCNQCGYECQFEDEDEARDNNWWQDDDGHWYCGDCHECCCECDNEFPSNELEWSDRRDGSVCRYCRDEYMSRCCVCEQLDNTDDMIGVTLQNGDRVMICQNCFENRRESGQIQQRNGEWFMISGESREGFTTKINLHPEVWQEINNCPDCYNEHEKCSRCLKKMANETELEETTLWVYDNLARSYHHSIHGHFKSTKLRKKHEHPYL